MLSNRVFIIFLILLLFDICGGRTGRYLFFLRGRTVDVGVGMVLNVVVVE